MQHPKLQGAKDMLLLLDNYDSFTHNLKDYLEQLGQQCLIVRNDETDIEGLLKLDFERIVLSPGPQRPADAGILNDVVKHFHKTHPMLGICLGHQAIGEFFGARLVKAAYPMHGKISEISHNGRGLFANIPSPYKVCRYHSLVLEWEQSDEIQAIAHAPGGQVMALRHSSLPVFGVQFHPEAILTGYGMELLKNWLTLRHY